MTANTITDNNITINVEMTEGWNLNKIETNPNLFHKMMLKAYEKKESASYLHFVCSLDTKHQIAVVCGDFYGQVLNGGFEQWHSNGYSGAMPYLIQVLEKMDTECSKKLLQNCLNFQADPEGYEDENEENPTDYCLIEDVFGCELDNFLRLFI